MERIFVRDPHEIVGDFWDISSHRYRDNHSLGARNRTQWGEAKKRKDKLGNFHYSKKWKMCLSNSLMYWQDDSGNLVLPEPVRWGKSVTAGVLVWGLCTDRHVRRVLWGYGLSTASQKMDLWIVRTSAQCSQATRNVMLAHKSKGLQNNTSNI